MKKYLVSVLLVTGFLNLSALAAAAPSMGTEIPLGNFAGATTMYITETLGETVDTKVTPCQVKFTIEGGQHPGDEFKVSKFTSTCTINGVLQTLNHTVGQDLFVHGGDIVRNLGLGRMLKTGTYAPHEMTIVHSFESSNPDVEYWQKYQAPFTLKPVNGSMSTADYFIFSGALTTLAGSSNAKPGFMYFQSGLVSRTSK